MHTKSCKKTDFLFGMVFEENGIGVQGTRNEVFILRFSFTHVFLSYIFEGFGNIKFRPFRLPRTGCPDMKSAVRMMKYRAFPAAILRLPDQRTDAQKPRCP